MKASTRFMLTADLVKYFSTSHRMISWLIRLKLNDSIESVSRYRVRVSNTPNVPSETAPAFWFLETSERRENLSHIDNMLTGVQSDHTYQHEVEVIEALPLLGTPVEYDIKIKVNCLQLSFLIISPT